MVYLNIFYLHGLVTHISDLYLDDDIDVRGEKTDEDGKLHLGEDQLPTNPDTRPHF